jgi:LysR family transcriptional regulator, regulator for bpeEF and oprC
MDTLQAMKIFVQVVDSGSFTAAAEILQLHRPAVTKAVQRLEQQAGARLLNRTTRALTLTSDGALFYGRCTDIIQDVSVAFGASVKSSLRLKGVLRIELPVTVANRLVMPALPEFRRRYPDIELVVSVGDASVDVIGEGLDCAVRIGLLGDLNVVAKTIGTLQVVTCGAPSYLARYGTPKSLTDLDSHLAVNYFSGRGRKIMDWSFLVDGLPTSRRLKSGIEVNESEAFLAAAIAGLGLVQGPHINIQGFLESGSLVRVMPDVRSPARPVSVLYPSRKQISVKVRAFTEWLSELFEAKGLT